MAAVPRKDKGLPPSSSVLREHRAFPTGAMARVLSCLDALEDKAREDAAASTDESANVHPFNPTPTDGPPHRRVA
jgi:hypothetical protein